MMPSSSPSAIPRDAATVVVVRDAATQPSGIEVLLLRRAQSADHNGGAWVFPGGLVDPGDRAATELPPGLTDSQACTRLKLEQGGLAYYLAAIRECFEEAGILFAVNAKGEFASLEAEAGWPTAALRQDVRRGRCTLADICRQFSLTLVPERLHYIAHWLTPVGRAKRFDTRFFVAIAPSQQAAMHDATETLDHIWMAPADALAPSNARRLMVPTRAVLEMLRGFAHCRDLVQWAAAPRDVERIQPRLALCQTGLESIPPAHPAYAEIGKLDPEGRCDAWGELRPNAPVRLGNHVVRITGADGRHTYRIGSDADGWEDVAPSSARLVAPDRMVIARDRTCVPPSLLEAADWLAAAEGFLQPL